MLMILHEVLAFTIQCANIRDERPMTQMGQCLSLCIDHKVATPDEVFDGWVRVSK
jgi:hypothetical protein